MEKNDRDDRDGVVPAERTPTPAGEAVRIALGLAVLAAAVWPLARPGACQERTAPPKRDAVKEEQPPQTGALPEGFVRGDVVSRSWVPIRTWTPKEGIGILPYLFEYDLMKWEGKRPLSDFHAENIRRIDIASRWSTAIMLYARYDEWRDELVNLMIRCFRNRQLIVFRNYWEPKKDEGEPYRNLRRILEKLWKSRDVPLTSLEGDRATGRELIDNILASKGGDEGECGLGTEGLERLIADFDREIRLREVDGERPFRHIKCWYNMLGYAALDYNGCYASSREDVEMHGRVKLPANTQCIGVDVYHWWFPQHSPFDPADPSIPRERVRAHSDEWQRIRTRYYPEGLTTRVCKGSSDPATWIPECWNDTHALLGAIELAGAKEAMMWYIGVSSQLGPGDTITYTTPIETMESYYDHLKAGPWVALSWWIFGDDRTCHGGLGYYDRTLKHYTREHPEGEPYSEEMLDTWKREYVAMKMRFFRDVVYNQFRHLNGPPPAEAPPAGARRAATAPSISGIYPHLAMFNDEAECGTGAVVPWADRLWVISYAPHRPAGSTDKLYEIDAALSLIVRPESVGGTPANRMVHRGSGQLFIGPYAIDARRTVRAIPPDRMFGRLTGNARHLVDPAKAIYFATMEEGLYEVDVRTLAVTELWADEGKKSGRRAGLPGAHGKGLYSGQGRLVYANNGEEGPEAQRRPDIPSGSLAEWDGKSDAWRVVRRSQFTEVTGPGGIEGNGDPDRDPLWSIGWDHRSLILMLLDGGRWSAYRLPKASHSYDGAHGWNTEWPRIRDVGEETRGKGLLMTMHGMFWSFPRGFAERSSGGIVPRSTYLKVVGDFCRWGDRIVFGCDDTAKSEFLNKRKAKGGLAGPGQSQSNLWFLDPEDLDDLGPPIGRGAVWLDEPVRAGEPSEPFLFGGFDRRGAHLAHGAEGPATFTFEVDRRGDGEWSRLRDATIPARGYAWISFDPAEKGAWVRVRSSRDSPKATVLYAFANADRRGVEADGRFSGLARPGDSKVTGGLVRARGANLRTLQLAAMRPEGDIGNYELGADLKLRRVEDPASQAWLKENAAIPEGVLYADEASVLFVDDSGKRWRLPKGDPAFDGPGPLGAERVDREVSTERDLFNSHGTFYELPAENAGGFAKIRPIATHNRRIHDYCSWRGLLVLSGVAGDAPADSPHIVRSEDGKAALWIGVADDLWKLGKPRGRGGPLKRTSVRAGEPSDPYLMTGYDRKTILLEHDRPESLNLRVEVDIAGTGLWRTYASFEVPAGEAREERFPEGFQAYWVRIVSERDARLTAELTYE